MQLLTITIILLIFMQVSNARFMNRVMDRKDGRSDRVVSVYDRNCFFSPMGCHFLKGRRAMTFITPTELKEEQLKSTERSNPLLKPTLHWLFQAVHSYIGQ